MIGTKRSSSKLYSLPLIVISWDCVEWMYLSYCLIFMYDGKDQSILARATSLVINIQWLLVCKTQYPSEQRRESDDLFILYTFKHSLDQLYKPFGEQHRVFVHNWHSKFLQSFWASHFSHKAHKMEREEHLLRRRVGHLLLLYTSHWNRNMNEKVVECQRGFPDG